MAFKFCVRNEFQFSNFVPISLIITIELVKVFQALLLKKDKHMNNKEIRSLRVQSSNLNEELGQIHHLFLDKTGTITKNSMKFKYLTTGETHYGELIDDNCDLNDFQVDFKDSRIISDLKNKENVSLDESLICLSLCHTVMIERKEGLRKIIVSFVFI